jgi:hypothetical protein
MSDQTQKTNARNDDTSQMQREFKIGEKLSVEDELLMGLTIEEAHIALSFAYPEVQNANMNTSVQNGQLVVEFMVKPGRKG